LKTTLVAVRLERTRDVLHELLRSLKEALPIVVGVAGPFVVITVMALLAWAGVPPMRAVTLPWREGVPLWLAQSVIAAWPLWALRRRLLPEAWCVQLRCLPFAGGALWRSDVAVSAAVLAPLALVYAGSAAVFAIHRPAWQHAWGAALASLSGSWGASCVLGAAALAWQRRGAAVRAVRAQAARAPETLLAQRPGLTRAVLWTPAWRGVLVPGAPGVLAGMAAALAVAACWVAAPWPVVPGAAWAFAFCALLVALTERLQRTLEAHLAAVAPWLATLPVRGDWRWRSRLLIAAPMVATGLAGVALVLATREWRGPPLAAFALGVVATPAALTALPASRREAHVGLWALCTGLMTALGSELWN
jgi:hypothetical protein